jgi:two-component system sensor histidine kinase KdpD
MYDKNGAAVQSRFQWNAFQTPLDDAWKHVANHAHSAKTKLALAGPSCLSLDGLAACTSISFHFNQSFAFAGFLDLIVVVLCALYGGFVQATLVSVVAAAALNYFFVPPIFSFVNSPANWVALGAFEFTALVISRLSLHAKQQALEAVSGRRDVERLYETSRRILLLDSSADAGNRIASLIREVFELQAASLFDAESGAMYQSGETPPEAGQLTRNAYLLNTDAFYAGAQSRYCVLRLGQRPVGGLALHGTEMTDLAATALASLTGIALERVRAVQREYRAEAARQTEQLRTAVLDAMAHQFKTPLTVLRTASSGLLAVGGLSEFQADLVGVIEKQACALDRMASRLLGAARLDTTAFKPQREPLLLSRLVDDAIRLLRDDTDRGRFRISIAGKEIPVLADREMIVTSISQFVDNALKYSEPASPIVVRIAAEKARVVLTMRNKGLVVASADRERVFDRFYRGPQTQYLPAGTGLGLSIVKEIVEAHRGRVWAEGEANYGSAFSMALPAASSL